MSDYARKIEALLAKAASTDSAEERDAFEKAAERLIIKWGISDAELSAARERKGAPETAIIMSTRSLAGVRYGRALAMMGAVVAEGIAPLKAFWDKRDRVQSFTVVGCEDDIRRASQYLPYLEEAVVRDWKAWSAARDFDTPHIRYRAMLSFFLAWADRVSTRFRGLRQEEFSTSSPGAELVLRDRVKRAEAFLQGEGIVLETSRFRYWEADAGVAGARAGDSVALVRGGVSDAS